MLAAAALDDDCAVDLVLAEAELSAAARTSADPGRRSHLRRSPRPRSTWPSGRGRRPAGSAPGCSPAPTESSETPRLGAALTRRCRIPCRAARRSAAPHRGEPDPGSVSPASSESSGSTDCPTGPGRRSSLRQGTGMASSLHRRETPVRQELLQSRGRAFEVSSRLAERSEQPLQGAGTAYETCDLSGEQSRLRNSET